MNRNLTRKLLSAVCAFALLLGLVPTAFAAGSPAVSDNYIKNRYGGNTAAPIKSYLYQNASSGLTRVEYIGNEAEKKIVVEDYSSSFQLQNSRTIPMELSRWGGFYAGSQYNYLVFGQENKNYSDSVEVIRIVKYSKDWQRLGQASVYGANTKGPFASGAVRCAESGGYLYVHTCHTMYPSSDGKNHQANMTVIVRESDMTVTDTKGELGSSHFVGYVSHSFNQFIMVDSLGNILTADHGDGSPRAMVIYKFDGMAGKPSIPASFNDDYESFCGFVKTEPFMGKIGDNRTNAQLGGIAETSSGYVMAYAMGDNTALVGAQQTRVAYISKSNFGHYFVSSGGNVTCDNTFQERVLTSYTGYSTNASAPYLVPTGLDGGWIIWNELSSGESGAGFLVKISYAPYYADGSVGAVKTVNDVALSDCQPILYNDQVVWYTTHDSAPVFYTLDASGVQSHPAGGSGTPSTPGTPSAPGTFSDVPASYWAYNDIMTCANQGIVSGGGNGKFDPEGTVTGVQFIAMMTRTFYSDKVAAVTVPAGSPWYYASVKVAEDVMLSRDVTVDENALNRYNMAHILYNELSMQVLYGKIADTTPEQEDAARASIKDYSSMTLKQQTYARHCYAWGVLSGMSDGAFSGESTMTRAQACAVIVRLMNLINS